MKPLITRKPKRFFVFGCSFTKYKWLTWPEIVAAQINVPYYNFARAGAGNQYIHNTLMQANALYNFNEDDLVMVVWANVAREDRWLGTAWKTPGNIYTQSTFKGTFFRYVDDVGFLIRDLALIYGAQEVLKQTGCQFHMSSIIDIVNNPRTHTKEKYETGYDGDPLTRDKISEVYNLELLPDFTTVLWRGNPTVYKYKAERDRFGEHFTDFHPSPIEQLTWLETLFSKFDANIRDQVVDFHETWVQCMHDAVNKIAADVEEHGEKQRVFTDFLDTTTLRSMRMAVRETLPDSLVL